MGQRAKHEIHQDGGCEDQSEVDVYAQQIKSVDEAIDTLVYALYGLSPEEINIVEGHG